MNNQSLRLPKLLQILYRCTHLLHGLLGLGRDQRASWKLWHWRILKESVNNRVTDVSVPCMHNQKVIIQNFSHICRSPEHLASFRLATLIGIYW